MKQTYHTIECGDYDDYLAEIEIEEPDENEEKEKSMTPKNERIRELRF